MGITESEAAIMSPWGQDLLDWLEGHSRGEAALIEEYRGFAERSESEPIRYLLRLIVDDETRHHRILGELINALRAVELLDKSGPGVPNIGRPRPDPVLGEQTRRFLVSERHDRGELKALAKRLAPLEETSMWPFLVELMEGDTERHIRILNYIGRLARRCSW